MPIAIASDSRNTKRPTLSGSEAEGDVDGDSAEASGN